MAQSYGADMVRDRTAARDPLNEMTYQIEDVASRIAEQGKEASAGMQEVAGNFKTAFDKSLRDQPMATLATAALAGFVLGAIWKA
jgi:ElaB/YqjD/DUF883 family membrane-anchored ribosome-binding protein